MGEEIKEPIMAEVFLESQIGTDTEVVLYTGHLVLAYKFCKRYNDQHPLTGGQGSGTNSRMAA